VERWDDVSDVPPDHGPSVVTIGNFDGVHRGHRALLAHTVRQARQREARAVAITFEPHPVHVLHPERAPALITGHRHRMELLAATGLDAVLVLRFTRELASWSPERFVAEVLVQALDVRAVVVGRDIRFGHRNRGDLSTMRELADRFGFDVVVLDDVHADERPDRRWSSTWARELLEQGDVAAAAEVLGRPHRLVGTVVHGDHRGRLLGYPTANLGPDVEGLVPADGVYAGWMLRLGLPEGSVDRVLPAAVSIGTNPTFDGRRRRVEAYVLDRDDLELYGQEVALELVDRLRETLRFDDAGALVAQMRRDVEQTRQVLSRVVTDARHPPPRPACT
jgi:riboflavin kinase/FMN adenylyltransferase